MELRWFERAGHEQRERRKRRELGAEPVGNSGAGGSGMAGAGGAGGGAPDPLLGVECGDQQCAIGEACIRCSMQGRASEQVCVPHPESDPTGFAAAVEQCGAQVGSSFDDCDGPD